MDIRQKYNREIARLFSGPWRIKAIPPKDEFFKEIDRIRSKRRLYIIAASFTLALTFSFFAVNETILKHSYEAGIAVAPKQVSLHNIDLGYLNDGTQIRTREFLGATRISLSGEMYLNNTSSTEPAEVVVHQGIITAVSAEANVYSRADGLYVRVRRGLLVVELNGNKQLVNSGEEIKVGVGGEISRDRLEVDYFASWRRGYLHFRQELMSVIVGEIGRQFGVEFQLDDQLSKRSVTCTIPLNLPIEGVMEGLSNELGIDYKLDNHSITLSQRDLSYTL
jgi:ferric-dicitrate binding protein FerR (iron transport regulator)